MYPPNATSGHQAVRRITISDPDNPSSLIIDVQSAAPQNTVSFFYWPTPSHSPEVSPQPKEHYALPIGLPVQAHGRLPDDNVCLASWLVTFLLKCRLRLSGSSYNRVRVELTGELLKILRQLSPSNDLICLALYYIRRMHARISEEDKLEHSVEDCQRHACVSIAVKRLYLGMTLACHWLGEVDKFDAKQFEIPTTRAEVFRAMDMLRWNLFVSRPRWRRWLQMLVTELTQSQDMHQAWCARLVARVLHKAVSEA
ncbi:hypothetical protein BDZ89DRAFT_1055632 [Hymenopellis radicata]|nr:hypothetical protein BDZ89DRAFT_1055632 [Hymenopellis radicata]